MKGRMKTAFTKRGENEKAPSDANSCGLTALIGADVQRGNVCLGFTDERK